MAKAVIFDFSGTLFRVEDARTRLRAVLAARGIAADEDEVAAVAENLQASGAIAGIPATRPVPEQLADVWRRRDVTPDDHRYAHLALTRTVGLPWPEVAEDIYDRQFSPESWLPYPDTAEVLAGLCDRGIPVAVLSNIVWDLRPTFVHHGVDRFVAQYVFSYREGVMKPDPRIFARACELLGHPPADVLMVGDDVHADGGAQRIGCQFRAVPHLPPTDRPRALLDAVAPLL